MVNKVILLGRIGKFPETGTFQSGTEYARFSLATSRKYTDRDGRQQEETEWHQIQTFGKLAEVTRKYVRKGDPLFVEGRIRYRKVTGDDGRDKFYTDIIAERIQLLGSKRDDDRDDSRRDSDTGGSGTPQGYSDDGLPDQGGKDDDLPF